jgi:hypothetical protein
MPNKRLAANERDMHRTVFSDQFEDAMDECVAAKIVQICEEFAAAKVRVAIGVAAGAAEGAFARDFDGKHWRFAA